MSFDRYPKKQQTISKILIKWDQTHLGMLLTNQVAEFTEAQYLQNELWGETDFLYAQKQPFDANILGLLRNAQILSKVHTRYFQNKKFALDISRINEGMGIDISYVVDIYRCNLLIQDMLRTI